MNYDLTRPCPTCPFLTSVRPFLTVARVREILAALVEQQATFSCHSSNEFGEDEDGVEVVTRENQHCAGALIMLEKIERPNQMMRISERLGLYDRRKLRMESPVYPSPAAMVKAYKGGWTMKNTGMVVVVALVAGLSGCGGVNHSLSKGEIKDVWTQVSDKDTIRVRGIGVPPEDAKSFTQKRGLARQAALVNARYEALALLRGIKVTGGLSVGKLMEKDSHIREIANQVIAGMEEVQVEWAKDDGAVVLLELKRDKLEKMLAEVGAADTSDAYRQAQALAAALPGITNTGPR